MAASLRRGNCSQAARALGTIPNRVALPHQVGAPAAENDDKRAPCTAPQLAASGMQAWRRGRCHRTHSL
jgi:hypothetical protein